MNTIDNINAIRNKTQGNHEPGLTKVYVHMGTCGIASGAKDVLTALKKEIKKAKSKAVKVITTGCAGICSKEPLITVAVSGQEPIVYQSINEEKMVEIFNRHIKGKEVVSEFAFARGMEYQIKDRIKNKGKMPGEAVMEESIPGIEEITFFRLQTQRVMRNRGLIDPGKISDYIGREGYQGAIKALMSMSPEEIIQEVISSKLRGRGGAGFPTGVKWKSAAKEKSEIKYIICNADEGDPGAYMDRSVLESDPHSVVEGMIIAAKAIGSHKGYIYCRAEYPLAVAVLTGAIEQARKHNLLGSNILGTGFDFDIEIYEGAGAFVCGEETALICSIQGERGTPRPRPPFPAQAGLWGKPTVINNVETLSNVPQIISNGSAWFGSIGTDKSKGTKVFSITGDIKNVGCVEVPIGTKLDTIVNEIGGGVVDGKRFKAAQLGGPSGGCIPLEHVGVAVDYETLQEYGAIMGSGGMIVMGDDKSAVDIARFFIEFCTDEACGKCIPGREGTKQMLGLLNKLCSHKGSLESIKVLAELANVIQKTALCGLCKTAVNPVLSTLRYFRNEYLEAVAGNSQRGCNQ